MVPPKIGWCLSPVPRPKKNKGDPSLGDSVMIRLGLGWFFRMYFFILVFFFSGEALNGLAVERSVSRRRSVSDQDGFLYSQERRSPGWRWKDPFLGDDPSRTRMGFFIFSGEALAGLAVERSVSRR